MTAHTVATTSSPRTEPLRWGIHALIGVAIGLLSPFTASAWPFALIVGIILGSSGARAARGEREDIATTLVNALVAAFAVIGMLLFGAIIGAVIAIPVVMLASFSMRAAAFASPIDRGAARILIFVIPVLMWLVVFPLLGFHVSIEIGG